MKSECLGCLILVEGIEDGWLDRWMDNGGQDRRVAQNGHLMDECIAHPSLWCKT